MSELPLRRPPKRGARRVVAVGGGKGGVGKSLVAANLAVYLAQLGKRVVAVDGDLGGANLHTFFGIDAPHRTLGDFLERRVGRLEDVVAPTPVAGLGLVSGARDAIDMASPRAAQRTRLVNQLRLLEVDYLVIDLGAGTGPVALDLFFGADQGVVVVIPEPTSVENAYRFLAAAFLRRCSQVAELAPLKELLLGMTDRVGLGGSRLPTPLEVLSLAVSKSPELGGRVRRELGAFVPKLVVNQAKSRADQELGDAIQRVAWRGLGIRLEVLGVLEADDLVVRALRRKTPIIVDHPDARICQEFDRMARRLVTLAAQTDVTGPIQPNLPGPGDNYYDLLDVWPGASEEEVRRAYRRAKALFAPDSIAAYGVFEQAARDAMLARLDQAHDVLVDPDKRRAYDRRTFPDGRPPPRLQRTDASPSPAGPTSPIGGRLGPAPTSSGRHRVLVPGRDPTVTVATGGGTGRTPRPSTPVGSTSVPAGAVPPLATASLGGEGAPPAAGGTPTVPSGLDVSGEGVALIGAAALPELLEANEITGPLLRAAREAQGLSLEELASRTKITVSQLRAIEAEAFQSLPAAVYVRGFVFQLAKALRLDAERVAKAYLSRYKRSLPPE